MTRTAAQPSGGHSGHSKKPNVVPTTDSKNSPRERESPTYGKSDDLPCDGSVVDVPDQGPDQPDEHGAPANGHICVQCHRDPPDGKERPVSYNDDTIWLHAECERFFIKEKMREQGIP